MTGFRWHPAARIIGPDGAEQPRLDPGPVVISDSLSSRALAQAMAAPGAFRIGAETAPAPDPGPVFETLTSGSSGAARRIRRSQASWIASFTANAGLFGLGPGRRVAVLGRLVHSLSLYGAVEALHLGAEVHLLDALRPDRQARAMAERGIDTLYATPAQLRLLTGAGAVLPQLQLVLVGGSKLDAGLRVALQAMAPKADVREFYGAAEASFITLADAATPDASVGRPYPGVEIDIRQGEVWVKSPYLFDGYASDPGSARWQDGWLTVGEMGRIEGGCLYLSGRAGRMVTVADQNVFPEEIEAFLAGQPGVVQAAVLPEPDALRGTVLYAVLMGDRADEARLLTALRAAFGPLKAPRRIVWRAEWPVLPSGKTDYAALTGGQR